MRTRRRLALVLAASTAAVTVAGLNGTAQSAPSAGGLVKGLHQAFEASPYRAPAALEAPAPGATAYLSGRDDSATFREEPPAATGALTQVAAADRDLPAAAWTGALPRRMRGAVELTWWWSSPTPTLADEVVVISLFADPGTPAARLVARAEVAVQAGAVPTRNVHSLPVDVTLAGPVRLEARPAPTSPSPALTVHYGSTTSPSSAAYRAASARAAAAFVTEKQQNKPARYVGPKLEVQAYYLQRDAAEPTVGIDKDGVAFMAAGAFDALPENPVTNLARTEIKRSTDGGKSWESVQIGASTDLTTVPPTTLDPYVYVDEDTGRVFNPELYLGCTYLQFSDDKGETWTQSPAACGQPVNDHQTLVTGPPPEGEQSLGIYPNYVYYCFNRVADASCGRSLDGGLTFLPAGEPAFLGVNDDGGVCGGLHGHIVTDNQGRLYLPKGHCGFPWLAISEDGAQTWRAVQVNDKARAAATHLAVDVDEAGTIYYLWWTAEDRLPLLSVSKDAGETWSAPLMVAPPGVVEVNFPTIDAGKAGQIAISFPGTTKDVDDPAVEPSTREWNYYVMTSLNADAAKPLFVSTTGQPVSDPIHRGNCGPGRCAGMFDFIDVEFAPSGEIWAAATDTCTAEADCNTKDGQRAPSAEGLSIRQLSGPGLAKPIAAPPATQPRPNPQPRPRVVPKPLPATGPPGVVAWVALVTAVGAVGVARRRRSAAR